jgi:hypothetical protein
MGGLPGYTGWLRSSSAATSCSIAWDARVLIARGEVAAAPSFYGDLFLSTEDEVDQALQRLLVPAQP